MRKYLCMIIMVCALCLTGCGKEEVAYDTENAAKTAGNEGWQAEEKSNGETLKQTLGINEDKWKETIGSDKNQIVVNAKIEAPDVSAMYTMEVSEHYYTPEEQKKIAEYFLDADTIRVNKDRVVTKEWAQKRLDYCNNCMQAIEGGEDERLMLSHEKKRLTDLVAESPALSDVSEKVQDYSENHYIGSKGGVEYTLSFKVREEEHISSWSLEAVDGSVFSSEEVTNRKIWYNGATNASGENQCNMTAIPLYW